MSRESYKKVMKSLDDICEQREGIVLSEEFISGGHYLPLLQWDIALSKRWLVDCAEVTNIINTRQRNYEMTTLMVYGENNLPTSLIEKFKEFYGTEPTAYLG